MPGVLYTQWEDSPEIVYVLDGGLHLRYCNSAWDRFALANGGEKLIRPAPYGICVLDVIPERMRRFYSSAYRQALYTGIPWVHHYECSSPSIYRLFRSTTTRDEKRESLIIANELVDESPR